jgi:glycosyltransferase involved in cell wall biosynthesis
MRLTLDLRLAPSPGPGGPDETILTLSDLAAVARRPAALLALLRARPYEGVTVVRDPRPLSAIQAGAEALAVAAPARRFQIRADRDAVDLSRPAYGVRAAADLAVAGPRELAMTLRLARAARAVAGTRYALPAPAGVPQRVAYLRTEPSLRWMGLHVGGAATHTSGVINGLATNGVDVEVYAPERPDGVEDVAVTVVEPTQVFHLVHWLTFFAYSAKIAGAAATRPVDAVYQRYALGSYAGLDLARRLDVPLILEFNGSEIWAELHWGGRRPPLLETLARLERRNLEDATLIVVVSDVLRDQLVEQGIARDRILVNPNGVDVRRLAPLRAEPPEAWRARLGRPEAPTVGFIGTFGLWHGVKLLPEIVAAVAQERPDARWIIVGDGPLFAEVSAEIADRGLADRVLLTGLVPRERATELLAACDVCVSPHVPNPDGSRFFGSPTKLFEYMGLGKPIVASDLDQIGEVIDDGRTGVLVPPGDPLASAEQVVRLLGDPGARARLGAAALAEAERTYSWPAHTRRILDAVAGLAQRR